MAEKKIQGSYLIVNAPFFYRNDQYFAAGQVVPADHPVVKRREHLFRPLEPLGAAPAPASASSEASQPTGLEAYAALQARAKELGLPASGKAADLEASIEAEEQRLASSGGAR